MTDPIRHGHGWPRRTVLAAVAAVPLAGLAGPVLARDPDAERFIARVGEQVVEILQTPDIDDAEQLARLKDLLDSYTDLELVARLVLGRHWRTASAEQRDDYVSLFREILMNTMADRLGDYGGETFEIAGSSELNERDRSVQTRIIRPNGAQPLRVDWRVRETGGDFAIIDVVAEGVSLVVSQRNEIGSIVERDGLDGLIETMRRRSGEGETVI